MNYSAAPSQRGAARASRSRMNRPSSPAREWVTFVVQRAGNHERHTTPLARNAGEKPAVRARVAGHFYDAR